MLEGRTFNFEGAKGPRWSFRFPSLICHQKPATLTKQFLGNKSPLTTHIVSEIHSVFFIVLLLLLLL